MVTIRVLKCPQCNGSLHPSRFARSVRCPYCGSTIMLDPDAVDVAIFRKASRQWNSECREAGSFEIDGLVWNPGVLVARGEHCDLYRCRRARWPTEIVLIKVLRSRDDLVFLEREWTCLEKLYRVRAGHRLTSRMPRPVCRGRVNGGVLSGREASVMSWAWGFRHDFDRIRGVFREGIDARISVWMWRRILEILTILHSENLSHGAVIPPHLLVEENEHGVRLVGFGRSGPEGRPGIPLPREYRSFENGLETLSSTRKDLAMSARSIIFVLGGSPEDGSVPDRVPPEFAAMLRDTATGTGCPDPWELREDLGLLAARIFGKPVFCPLEMPE